MDPQIKSIEQDALRRRKQREAEARERRGAGVKYSPADYTPPFPTPTLTEPERNPDIAPTPR